MEGAGIPGLAVSVALDSSIVYSEGFGTADLMRRTPVGRETLFRLASVSKPLTAVAAMRLIELGLLDPDAPIGRYCPEFPEKEWPVTARQLLSHTAGVRHYGSPREFGNTTHYDDLTSPLEIFAHDSLLFRPGTAFHYSSYGYLLLGCVMEGASGIPYAECLRRFVLEPAGMTSTSIATDTIDEARYAGAYGRDLKGSIVDAPPIDVSDRIPGGGIISSADDLATFAIALGTGRLLSGPLLRMMATPQRLEGGATVQYGLGWIIADRNDERRILHDGSQFGVRTLLLIVPARRVSVAVLANMEGDPTGRVIEEIAEIMVREFGGGGERPR